MSARQDDDRRIAEIWVATMQLRRRLAASGISRETFVQPRTDLEQLLVDGLYHGLERVVEECVQLSFSLKSRYPEVPWDQIGGLRNRLVHDYPGTSLDIVWSVIAEDLDVLVGACEDYCRSTGTTPAELMLHYPEDVTQDPSLADGR
jgi:uncharacterized protein with HEPN domain